MKIRPAPRLWPAVILLVAAVSVEAAFLAGGLVYTKRIETKLLAEPRPLAPVTGKVRYASELKIEEVRAPWLRVREGANHGWVFAGNIAETKPALGTGADSLHLTASETTATAAARPLTPAAEDYAARRNLVEARDDLNWLLEQCQAITPENVETFLQAQKKGEYQ